MVEERDQLVMVKTCDRTRYSEAFLRPDSSGRMADPIGCTPDPRTRNPSELWRFSGLKAQELPSRMTYAMYK